MRCTMRSGAKFPEAEEFSRIFVLTLQSVRLLFYCKLQKKLREQDVLVTPPIILLGSPCSPGSRAYALCPGGYWQQAELYTH